MIDERMKGEETRFQFGGRFSKCSGLHLLYDCYLKKELPPPNVDSGIPSFFSLISSVVGSPRKLRCVDYLLLFGNQRSRMLMSQ